MRSVYLESSPMIWRAFISYQSDFTPGLSMPIWSSACITRAMQSTVSALVPYSYGLPMSWLHTDRGGNRNVADQLAIHSTPWNLATHRINDGIQA